MSCITEILKMKGDKESLIPEGNWIAVEGGGVYRDYEYLIVLNTQGHRCGYVAIPPDHKYSQTPEEQRTAFGSKPYSHWDYDSLNISCHGGLTFMSPRHRLKNLLTVPCNDMWIGFDCGHCDDRSDAQAFRKYFGEEKYKKNKEYFEGINRDPYGSIKTFSYVEKQCMSIIDQLIEAA